MTKQLHSTYFLKGNVRAHLIDMDNDQVYAKASQFNIDVSRLVEEIEIRTRAMDEYILSTKQEFTPKLVRWRLKMIGAMGGIASIIFMTTLCLLWLDYVQSENANTLAGIALLGSGGLIVIAVWAAFHVVLEAALHFWGRAKVAEDLNGSFASAAKDFGKINGGSESKLYDFLCRSPQIKLYLQAHEHRFHVHGH